MRTIINNIGRNQVKKIIILGCIIATTIGSSSVINAKTYKLSGTYEGRNIYSYSKTKIRFDKKNRIMKVYVGGKKYSGDKLSKIRTNVYKVKGTTIRVKLYGKKIRVYASDGRDGKIPYGGTFKKVAS